MAQQAVKISSKPSTPLWPTPFDQILACSSSEKMLLLVAYSDAQ
jgi:hypothetical protein